MSAETAIGLSIICLLLVLAAFSAARADRKHNREIEKLRTRWENGLSTRTLPISTAEQTTIQPAQPAQHASTRKHASSLASSLARWLLSAAPAAAGAFPTTCTTTDHW